MLFLWDMAWELGRVEYEFLTVAYNSLGHTLACKMSTGERRPHSLFTQRSIFAPCGVPQPTIRHVYGQADMSGDTVARCMSHMHICVTVNG